MNTLRIDYAEPVPWKQHAWVWNPWKYGTCECGHTGWLRYYPEEQTFACLHCWMALPDKMRWHRYHGYESDLRLVWLWEQVEKKAQH